MNQKTFDSIFFICMDIFVCVFCDFFFRLDAFEFLTGPFLFVLYVFVWYWICVCVCVCVCVRVGPSSKGDLWGSPRGLWGGRNQHQLVQRVLPVGKSVGGLGGSTPSQTVPGLIPNVPSLTCRPHSLTFTFRAFSRRFYPKRLTSVETPTAESTTQGDSQLIRSSYG